MNGKFVIWFVNDEVIIPFLTKVGDVVLGLVGSIQVNETYWKRAL